MAEPSRRRPGYLATQRTTRERLRQKHRAEDERSGVVPLRRLPDPYRDRDGRDIDFDELETQ